VADELGERLFNEFLADKIIFDIPFTIHGK
jgi:hypothetical protein